MDCNTLSVTGHSDDLIHIQNADRSEIHANYNAPTHLRVGNTEIVAEYDGEWTFEAIDIGEDDVIHKYPIGHAEVVERYNEYTEELVVESESTEVVLVE